MGAIQGHENGGWVWEVGCPWKFSPVRSVCALYWESLKATGIFTGADFLFRLVVNLSNPLCVFLVVVALFCPGGDRPQLA